MDLRHALFLCLFLCKMIPCFLISSSFFDVKLLSPFLKWAHDFNYQVASTIW